MNNVETIQSAIEKLSQLRREACGPGPWTATDEGVMESGSPVVENGIGGPAWWSDGDRDLVVTLHATIDAQLDLLRKTLEFMKSTPSAASHEGPVIDLALAILGEQAADD